MSPMVKVKDQSFFEKLVPVLLVASIILAFFVGVLWQKVNNLESGNVPGTANVTGTQQNPAEKPSISIDKIKDLFKKDLIKFGDEGNKVLFVQVSDPSCPWCHVAAGLNPEINALMRPDGSLKPESQGGTYSPPVIGMRKLIENGQASYVYIYQNGHGAGEMAQKAMYCAYEMDKFWEVHDLLMTKSGYDLINNTVKNDKSKSQVLADFLKSAVDPAKLKACLDSGKYDDRIASDVELAKSIGIGGTPGFYVNATNFSGAQNWKTLEAVVNEALK